MWWSIKSFIMCNDHTGDPAIQISMQMCPTLISSDFSVKMCYFLFSIYKIVLKCSDKIVNWLYFQTAESNF